MSEIFEGSEWLQVEYQDRVRKGKDFIVIVDDMQNDRGSGKTTLSIRIGDEMDRAGGLTYEKTTYQPSKIPNLYTELPNGSGLVFEEGSTSASKYRQGSKSNMALRKVVEMGRVEEVYMVINCPNMWALDGDLLDMCHAWISVERQGLARVHKLKYRKYADELVTPWVDDITWDPIEEGELKDIYDQLDADKRARLRGEEGEVYSPEDVKERVKSEREETARETTREHIIRLSEHTDLNQTKIGEAVGKSQAYVSNVLRARADGGE